jgi:hypothetical protein
MGDVQRHREQIVAAVQNEKAVYCHSHGMLRRKHAGAISGATEKLQAIDVQFA